MNVLALDPGKMTGVAWWTGGSLGQVDEFGFFDVLTRLDNLLEAYGDETVIVCEAYIISAQTLRKTRQTWSLEVIGAARYLAEKHGAEFATLQKPGDVKSVVTDSRLRKLGWWTVGKEHGRDATRHLAYYLLGHGLLDPALIA